jgi:hypothetical protein
VAGDSLSLRFYDDGDGTGKLVVRAAANGFSGESGAYFDATSLTDFARRIGEFPIAGRPSASGGFYSKTARGELEQEHVALVCYPVDARGHIGIQVRLATELWPPARPESRHSVSLEILTTYEPLGRFSRGLLGLLAGTVEEAVLEGDS